MINEVQVTFRKFICLAVGAGYARDIWAVMQNCSFFIAGMARSYGVVVLYGSRAEHGNDHFGGTVDPILPTITPLIGLLFMTLAGCTTQGQDRQTSRPVNVVRIADQTARNDMAFSGEVRARFETVLSFRVAGKLINRTVDIGNRVRKGQVLAKLDPSDYRLAAQNLNAQLIAAKADREYSKEDLTRYRELFDQHVISQPELDRHQTLYISAQQKVAALEALLEQAGNQLAYTGLLSDSDGVVTALEAETGQVVALGQPVIKLARLDEKEIAIDIPEHRIAGIKLQQEVGVTLWVDGDKRIKARIREIAAAADPVSRTYRVKATILEGKDDARLGMTATVWIPASTPDDITVPLSAVFTSQHQPGQTSVWLVDERTATVKAVPVQAGAALPGERVAVSGLEAGQLIVSAGANRLIEGQAVRLPQQFKTAMDSYSAASDNTAALKPSPEGEGWVRGNQNKEESLFNPPHPGLIMADCPVRHPAGECKSAPGGFVPEGEGERVLKSAVLIVREASSQ